MLLAFLTIPMFALHQLRKHHGLGEILQAWKDFIICKSIWENKYI